MTSRPSAKRCSCNSADDRALAAVRRCICRAPRRTAVMGERGGISPDAGRMSTSTVACYRFYAPALKQPASKATPQGLLVTAAVTAVVIGCGWMVYVNIFAASPYPEIGNAGYEDAPVVRRFANVAVRPVARPEPAIEMPDVEPPVLSFVDRFAAAPPQGVAPAPVSEASTKIAVAPKPEPLKLSEAPKAREIAKEPSKEASKETSRMPWAPG